MAAAFCHTTTATIAGTVVPVPNVVGDCPLSEQSNMTRKVKSTTTATPVTPASTISNPFAAYFAAVTPMLTALKGVSALAQTMPKPLPPATWQQFDAMTRQFTEALMPPKVTKGQKRAPTKAGGGTPNAYVGLHPEDVMSTLGQFSTGSATQPGVIAEQQATLARDLMAVLAGTSELAPQPGDKRFADEEWTTNPFYRGLLQSYLAWSNSFHGIIDRASPCDRSAMRMGYLGRLLTDALAPSNSLLGNPAAMRKAVETGGASVTDGLKQMLEDLVHNNGMPSQVDKNAFQVGGNLAVSPGAVVFRNPVLELIQYRPTTAEVHARPQILVPPHVNKFYLLDMAPGRSMVEYLVASGFQVFMVSWRNPTAEHRDWDMDTFCAALIEAIDAVRDITGSEDVNIHGICGGARTLAGLLGHLAAVGNRVVNATTLVVCTMIADEDPLGPFADADAIAIAKRKSEAAGVLDGSELSRTFTWAKPNDLVWNYWVSNYLMGEPPAAFDILFWNTDSTRLPAALHAQLLDVFSRNLFAVPGGLTILGTPIDLAQVECDTYVVGGLTDHIGPWQSVYNTAAQVGGDSRFILCSGGHIQSIITPPTNRKIRYFANPNTPKDSAEWMSGAAENQGSWWPDWSAWIAQRSGPLCPAPVALGNQRHLPLADAPGTYVLEK
jgi:polyhydroxyalkanoate synthase